MKTCACRRTGEKLTGAQVADLEAWVKMERLFPQAGVHERQDHGASTYTLGLSTGDRASGSSRQATNAGCKLPVDAFVLAADLSELEWNRHGEPTGER